MGLFGETVAIGSRLFRRLRVDADILSQAIVMRLSTARGTLWTDPDYGLLLTDYLNEGLTADALARLPLEIQAQIEQDERITSVTAEVATTQGERGVRLTVALFVTASDGTTFPLTLGVDALGVEILTRGAA